MFANDKQITGTIVSFSNIPTFAAAGCKDVDFNPCVGLFAPAKVPTAIIHKINADVNDLMKLKDIADKFATQSAEPYQTTSQEFAAILKADIDKWGKVVKASGATVD